MLELSTLVDVVHFAEAGPLDEFAEVDLAIIEGSVNTHHDIHRLEMVREKRNIWYVLELVQLQVEFRHCVILLMTKACLRQHGIYPQDTDVIIKEDLSTAKPISAYVPVDFEIPVVRLRVHRFACGSLNFVWC